MVGRGGSWLRADHQPAPRRKPTDAVTHQMSQSASHLIATHRRTDRPADHEADPCVGVRGSGPVQVDQQRRLGSPASGTDRCGEVGRSA